MDFVATVIQEAQQGLEKVEQDDSFKMNSNEESGVFSNGSNSIASNTSSWIFYENEVMDASVFSLPEFVQSSNIKLDRPEAEFSSISQEFSLQAPQGTLAPYYSYTPKIESFHINLTIGQRESTHIGQSEWATPRVEGLFKLESEGDENDEFHKEEFENSFGTENDASFEYKFSAFPKALNPGFDLQIALSVSTFFMAR